MRSVKLSLVAGLVVALGLLAGLAAQTLVAHASSSPTPVADAPGSPDPVTISGRVVDADGQPVAGAKIILPPFAAKAEDKPPAQATAGPDGHFTITVAAADVARGRTVIATAPGFGPDWIQLKEPAAELTLRLPKDDLPVQGRLLDLQGRPVSGVTVQVRWLQKSAEADLTFWLDEQKKGRTHDLPGIRPAWAGVPAELTTDADGRFRFSGVGRERVAVLILRGPIIEQNQVWAVTRPALDEGFRTGNYSTHPATFQHLVGPSRSIVGTVREKGTGKPIEGITVLSCMYGNVTAMTDKEGRYRIDGAGQHDRYAVSAGGKLPYFNCTTMELTAPPGLAPITVDFELEKGIVITGRVIDKATGKPVRGRVSYRYATDNPHLKDFTDITRPQVYARGPGGTAADGTFTALAIPGPGSLCVVADDANAYAQRIPQGLNLGGLILECYHAVVPITVTPDDPKGVTFDVALEPARALTVKVVDPDGKPLAWCLAPGKSVLVELGIGREPDPVRGAEFVIGGLTGPRTVLVYHPDRKLAKLLRVRGDEPAPLTVRLEPLGAATGRVVGPDGKPRDGATVTAAYSFNPSDSPGLPRELTFEYPTWNKLLKAQATAGADGRFRLEGLVPGVKYDLKVAGEGAEAAPAAAAVVVEAGRAKDVGDLKPGGP